MKKLLGGILLAIGLIIAGGSGLCSLVFFIGLFSDRDGRQTIPIIAIVGGVPFGIGLALFYAGRAMLRSARDDKQE